MCEVVILQPDPPKFPFEEKEKKEENISLSEIYLLILSLKELINID